MKTIMTPVDFSKVTEQVIFTTTKLAHALDAQVILIHVAAPDPQPADYDAGPKSVRDIEAKKLQEKHMAIHQQADRIREMNIPVTALLIKGEIVDIILNKATDHHADLIVMGSHGHGALYHLLMGSISEGVMRKTGCPILFVPSKQ